MCYKKISSVLVSGLLLLSLSGCIALIAGAAGAVGGYAVTKDTFQGEYDAEFSKAWKAATEVCSMLGTVSIQDSTAGIIDSVIDRAKVRVELTQLTSEAIRIKVKARKGLFPSLETAEKVFVKIVQQLM